MREPAIHIRLEHLILVIKKISKNNNLSELTAKELANLLLVMGKPYSCTNRSLVASTNKLVEKSHKLSQSSREDAGIFANMLTLKRKQAKHQGILPISPGSTSWLTLKDITKLALSFCEEYGLNKKNGFEQYIQIGLEKMGRYSLNKFAFNHSKICSFYEANRAVESDLTPINTKVLYNAYKKLSLEKTGMCVPYENDPEQYVYFIKAKNEANRLGITEGQYVEAQFAGLDFVGAVPSPSQLVEGKSAQRLQSYLSENGIKANQKAKRIDWDKIKQ